MKNDDDVAGVRDNMLVSGDDTRRIDEEAGTLDPVFRDRRLSDHISLRSLSSHVSDDGDVHHRWLQGSD